MKRQIRFTSGGKNGEKILLEPNRFVSIGRSRSNTVCLQEPDVSGRHITIRFDGEERVCIEILSSRITKHNDKNVNMGDIIELSNGDLIQMGENVAFVFEYIYESASSNSDDEKTEYPQTEAQKDVPDNIATQPEQECVSPDEEKSDHIESISQMDLQKTIDSADGESMETFAFQTRIASDDELESIKKAYRRKQRIRVLLIGIPAVLFLAGTIFLYFYLKPQTEENLSWPKDDNDKFLNAYVGVTSYFALCFPETPFQKVKKTNNEVNVFTRIGKLQDVNLHIVANSYTDRATLELNHGEAFEKWRRAVREKDPTVNWGEDKKTQFICRDRGAGVPISYMSYTRRVKNDDFFGYAVFCRRADNIHFAMIEVPLQSRSRAMNFFRLHIEEIILYAPIRAMDHWEGASDYRRGSTIQLDLQEAENYMNQKAPVYFGKIFYRLRSALIKATLAGDEESVKKAIKLLLELRERQALWYNTQKLAYQYAENLGDKRSMQSIQDTCASVFSSEFQDADFRYDLIHRKDWQ